MGDSIVDKRNFKSGPISFPNRATSVDFVGLDMVDFYFILGMGLVKCLFFFHCLSNRSS